MPKRIEVTPKTTTGLTVEKFVLPDAMYAEAEEQAVNMGFSDLNAYLKHRVKELVRVSREQKKQQEVNTLDLDAL